MILMELRTKTAMLASDLNIYEVDIYFMSIRVFELIYGTLVNRLSHRL